MRDYQPLNDLKALGVQVLGAPTNQFGYQEPAETAAELRATLKHVRPGSGFEPNFPLLEKQDINGKNEAPLFSWLKESCEPLPGADVGRRAVTWSPTKGSDAQWNFEKFLIAPGGQPCKRYSSNTPVADIIDDIHMVTELNGCPAATTRTCTFRSTYSR